MALFCRENLVNHLRWAVVFGGVGLSFMMPPPAKAFGAPSEDPAESFASLAQWDSTFVPDGRSQPWQYGVPDADRHDQDTAGRFDSFGETSKYGGSFAQTASDQRWDNGTGWYWHGEGWRPFQGGGWWHEHWHCNDCGRAASPVPESGTSTTLIVGLLILVISLARQGQRTLLGAR